MKRYMVFSGEDYYPNGGMEDFDKDFDIIEEAIEFAKKQKGDWIQIYDIVSKQIIVDEGYFRDLGIGRDKKN